MPSVILGNPLASGAQIVVSGNVFSGRLAPVGGVQLAWDRNASGNVYIGLSGGMTVNSGGMFLSGGGLLDGMQVGPGGVYFIPKIALATSGAVTIYAQCDAACSGVSRLYWEAM